MWGKRSLKLIELQWVGTARPGGGSFQGPEARDNRLRLGDQGMLEGNAGHYGRTI